MLKKKNIKLFQHFNGKESLTQKNLMNNGWTIEKGNYIENTFKGNKTILKCI